MFTARQSFKFVGSLAAAAACFLHAPAGRADQLVWQGSGGQSWFVDDNWIGDGHTPVAGDSAEIDAGPEVSISGATAAVSQLHVGANGLGRLQILDPLNSDIAVLGDNTGSEGRVAITGSSAVWTNTGRLTIGDVGIGTLAIETAGQYLGTGMVYVGAAIGGVGTITVSGTSVFNTTDALYIGYSGQGTFDLTAGGTSETANAYLGYDPGSSGAASISGGGTSWTVDGDLTIGVSGTGTLTISTGAVVANDNAVIGGQAASTGSSVQITGSGSRWTSSGQLIVGDAGEANLSVFSRATISSGSTIIGRHADGAVRVGGSGSVFDTGNILIGGDRSDAGSAGNATLDISGAGEVDSQTAVLGDAAGSAGTVTVNGSGSLWDVASNLSVGGLGEGNLTISNGAVVQSVSGFVGDDAGSSGDVIVTGAGSLWQNSGDIDIGRFGTGTLDVSLGGSVTADGTLIGSQTGSAGTVTVTGDGSSLQTADVLYVGKDGDGTLRIADGGIVSADAVYIASQAGSTGTVIIGAALGQTSAGRATLDTSAIHFGTGTGSLVFNFGGAQYELTATIDGDGDIEVGDGDVTLKSDSSGFSGTTTISGGSLFVDGRLGGTVVVDGYGTLGGIGTIGSTVVNSGSTIAPGDNGVGTLTIDGDITFNSGSNFSVDLGQSGSDAIHSTGNATINGGTLVVSGSGFDPAQSYTVLSVDGGTSGQFSSVNANYAFLTASLGYQADDVVLTLARNGISFASIGGTANQQSVAGEVESLGMGNALYNAVATLGGTQAQDAFAQLAGDMHTSATAVSFDNSRFVRTVGIDRLRSSFSSVGSGANTAIALGRPAGATDSNALAFGETGAAPANAAEAAVSQILADPQIEKVMAWGQAYGAWGRLDGSDNASALTNSAGGLMIGADAPLINSSWRLGAMAGFGRTSFSQSNGLGSGDSNDYSVGVYGGNQWGPLGLRLGALYTLQDISTRRSVEFSGFSDALSADYKADTTQIYGELGYALDLSAVQLEPFANLAYVYQRTDGFTENGGAAALQSDATQSGVVFTTLGMRSSTELSLADIKAIVHSSLGWRNASGDIDTVSSFSFAGGNDFTTVGSAVDGNAVVIEAGVDMQLSRIATIGLVFTGNYSSESSSQVIKAQLQARY